MYLIGYKMVGGPLEGYLHTTGNELPASTTELTFQFYDKTDGKGKKAQYRVETGTQELVYVENSTIAVINLNSK